MDAQTIRRAISDLFRFNPKQFTVRASATGFLVSFLGNASGSSTTTSAPTVSSLSVSTGPRIGGTAVTITGTNFTGAIAVLFGAVAADFVLVNETTITTTTPNYSVYSETVVAVRVFTSGGANAPTSEFTYT